MAQGPACSADLNHIWFDILLRHQCSSQTIYGESFGQAGVYMSEKTRNLIDTATQNGLQYHSLYSFL